MSEPTIQGTEGQTGDAPPRLSSLPPLMPSSPFAGFPPAGETVGDFELLRVLGSGAFARVYLARQVSLERQVALKATRQRFQEGRTLARMEHDHIVSVYSEAEDLPRGLHLLCMQYVPGTTLEAAISHLAQLPPEQRDGAAILNFLDGLEGDAPPLDLAALRDRELLAGLDSVEMLCWMGGRLAEALAHAHALGVLHRDIKPANILVNRYGRPLLADFNVARSAGSGENGMGGTLPYMAPEHLDAFRKGEGEPDERSDLYSLGVVLWEVWAGQRPFASPRSTNPEALEDTARQRRAGPPPLPFAPPGLERLLARCLAGDPAARHASSSELARDLDSLRTLHRARRDLPAGGVLTGWATVHPMLFVFLLIPLVHVVASIVNIAYNALRIVSRLSAAQQNWFPYLVLTYNAVAWPVCLRLFVPLALRVLRIREALARPGPIDAAATASARREALRLPGLLAFYSCVGWLPGGVLFPAALQLLAPPLPFHVWEMFAFSFLVAGLIAIVYSALLMELLVTRVLYPSLWADARGMGATAREDLVPVEARLGRLQMLAVLIPLAGAGLLLGVGPDQFTAASYAVFRLLVASLLTLGLLGLWLATTVSAEIRHTVAVLTGRT